MKYYIKSNGKTYGPIEENKIKDRVLSGFFSDSSLVSTDFKEWLPLQQCIPSGGLLRILRPTAVKNTTEASSVKIKPPRMRLTADNVVHRGTIAKERGTIAKEKEFHFSKKLVFISASVFVFLLLCAVGGYFFLAQPPAKKNAHTTPNDFQQVCRMYQSAVGVVTVTLEDSNGKLLNAIGDFKVPSDYPIGTAFAIDKNKFATNCHVAYGVKDQKNGVLENVLWHIVINDAQRNNGVKNRDEFVKYCKKHMKEIEKFRDFLHANVRVRNVEIRLAHSGGRSLPVTGVQIHPRYQTAPDDDFAFKNGEFDVAILTTGESVDKFFKIAALEKLYALAPGQEIAYIGFPMEGLHDNGNLDLNRPEAIFKSGTINKITDFNNVFSTPEFNKSIIHDIPAAGGASGSPIFLPNGEVVAILWGVTHTGKSQQGRIASATQHNMAVRIDSLDAVKKQRTHNLQDWLGEVNK